MWNEVKTYLKNLIDFSIISEYRDYRFAGSIKAHEIFACPLQIYYKYNKKQNVSSLKLQRYAWIGSIFTDYLERHMGIQNESDKYVEIKIDDELTIRGKLDVILYDNKYYELKTAFYLPKEPFVSHLAQVQVYIQALDLQYMYLVYISKKDLELKEFIVYKDDLFFQRIIDKARHLLRVIKGEEDPMPKPNYYCKECRVEECRYHGKKVRVEDVLA